MELENIEGVIDKSEEESNKEENEDEKSMNEEEEEQSEKAKEENPENIEENKIDNKYQEKNNQKENEKIKNSENQNQEVIDIYSTTTYILKYKRSKEELKELAIETNLPKSENCFFMINLKIIKNKDLTDNTTNNINNEQTPNFLVICCHEIAAIYFDEIYERIYTLEDLFKENIFFKVFDTIEEARNIIDESIKNNEKNPKKVFIQLKDKELKLHMRLSFFDKEKEIIFNIPKKTLSDEDKNNLLPEFLKEIQKKMNSLKDENKKLKTQKRMLESTQQPSDFLIETEIKNENEPKIGLMDENLEIKNKSMNVGESKSVKKKIVKKKIKKKTGKEPPKKNIKPEENFF
jgi:hypothetical protein